MKRRIVQDVVRSIVVLALSVSPTHGQDVDLAALGARGFRLDGIAARDYAGYSVSGAGDFNGDGLADVIVGAPHFDVHGAIDAGEAYLVFGRRNTAPADLLHLDKGGVRIQGANAGDAMGSSVSGAGDVNGDGLADAIACAPGAAGFTGECDVIFGQVVGAPIVDLRELGARGFRVVGRHSRDLAGISVSGAGDVNADGLSDLIVGAPGASPASKAGAGESYVVFGKRDTTTVLLDALGSGGFRIEGVDARDQSGDSVSGAGDVNGDGFADVIVGAPYAKAAGGLTQTGAAYVIFGGGSVATVQLATLGSRGKRIDGVATGDRTGIAVSGAGDVNGDGFADVIVGASGSDPDGLTDAGGAAVIFGLPGAASINLAALGSGGFRIQGAVAGDVAGSSVAGAGDVNGDGLADVVIGVPQADPAGRFNAGGGYVVSGRSATTTVKLGELAGAGFRLQGVDDNDGAGGSVSGAGDVNGDGLADLVLGAPCLITSFSFGCPGTVAGEAYVVFSAFDAPRSAVYRAWARTGDAPVQDVGTSGNGRNDSTPDSRAWIDFARGWTPTGTTSVGPSMQTVKLLRGAITSPGVAADGCWRVTGDRTSWGSAEVKFRYLDRELRGQPESRLQLLYAPTPTAPFTPLPGVVNPLDNTISAVVSEFGYFCIGLRATSAASMAKGGH